MDWVDPISSELAEEKKDNISSLAVGFSKRMRKRAMSTHTETTPGSKVQVDKCPKRYGLNEEAQKSPKVINVDSPE